MKKTWVSIPDVLFFQEGPGVRNTQYTAGGIKLLNVANLVDGKIDLSTSDRYISEEEAYGRYRHFLCDEGDFIVASSGLKVEYIDKKMGFVEKSMLPLCMNTSTIRFKVLNQNQLRIRYFMYYLKSNHFKKQLARQITGSAQLNYGPSHLKKMVVPLVDISVQDEIVSKMDAIQHIIDLRNSQLMYLDDLVKARFVEMFGDDKYSKMPLINLITEGAGLSYGIVQPGDSGTGDMGVLRPVDMVNGEISTHSIKYIDRSIGASFKKTELVGDELLITVRGTTGVTALTDSRFKNMNVTRGIAVIRYDRRKINPIYLNAFLNTDESQQYIQEHTRGATLQQINLSDLRVHMIPVPPIELQEKLADFIEQVDKSKVAVQKSLDEAQLLFDSLMQQYFG